MNRTTYSSGTNIQVLQVWKILQIQEKLNKAFGRGMWKRTFLCLIVVRLSGEMERQPQKASQERSRF